MEKGFPQNTAVISFYTPKNKRFCEETRVNYNGVCNKVFYVGIPDIDIEILSDYGYTYETYLAEADELAKFTVTNKNFSFLCSGYLISLIFKLPFLSISLVL